MEPFNEQLDEYFKTHKSSSNNKQDFSPTFSYDMYKKVPSNVPRILILKDTMEKINGNRENL